MLYPSELQPRFDNSLILYCFGGRREIFRTFKNMHCSRNVVVSGQDTTGNPLLRLPRLPGLESETGNPLRPKVITSRLLGTWPLLRSRMMMLSRPSTVFLLSGKPSSMDKQDPRLSDKKSPKRWWKVLGPGIVSGASDNDPTTVASLARRAQ